MEHKEAWPENEERLLQPLQQNVPRFAHDTFWITIWHAY